MKYLFHTKILFSIICLLTFGMLFSCSGGSGIDNGGDTDGGGGTDGGGTDNGGEPHVFDPCADTDLSMVTIGIESYRLITDQAGLHAIVDDLSAHYILCDDITLDATFTSINAGNFTGIFEGNHKTISELKIQSESDTVGLFKKIDVGAKIRNLHVALADGNESDPSISGVNNVGALAGGNNGEIENVFITGGYVKGTGNQVGGLVGFSDGSIRNSYVSSNVKGNNNVGGLLGYHNGGVVTNSYTTGSVTGNNTVGGVAGYNKGGSITHSYATGSITGNFNASGVTGYNSGTITDSYFDSTTTGRPQPTHNRGTAYYTYIDDGKVYTEADAGGEEILQRNFNEWDFAESWIWQGAGIWPTLQFQHDDYSGDVTHIADLCADVDLSQGMITIGIESYHSITDQADLQAIEDSLTADYILCDDITLDSTFTSINAGDFNGILEGNHKTISELKIQAESNTVGLFGAIGFPAKIRNLYIVLADGDESDPSISGVSGVGALTGGNSGEIKSVIVTGGYVKGTGNQVGGLIGSNAGTVMASSYVAGAVEGNNNVGGLIGYNKGTITDSYTTSTVAGNNSVGGLIGYNNNGGSITHSYATGSITGATNFSGVVGFNKGTITDSYFDATTTGRPQPESTRGTAYYTYDGEVYTEADGGGLKIAQNDFNEWDFDTMWTWQGEGQWPILGSQ